MTALCAASWLEQPLLDVPLIGRCEREQRHVRATASALLVDPVDGFEGGEAAIHERRLVCLALRHRPAGMSLGLRPDLSTRRRVAIAPEHDAALVGGFDPGLTEHLLLGLAAAARGDDAKHNHHQPAP